MFLRLSPAAATLSLVLSVVTVLAAATLGLPVAHVGFGVYEHVSFAGFRPLVLDDNGRAGGLATLQPSRGANALWWGQGRPQQVRGTPGVRNAHAMAYDERRGRLVLFGGADDRQVLGDTWEFDGRAWHLKTREGPPSRTFTAVAYHAARGTVMLFGGNRVLFGTGGFSSSTLLSDFWEWDGAQWVAIGASGPPARSEGAMAYDRARDRLVLFGGYTVLPDGSRRRLADTWEWDGSSWHLMQDSGPRARSGIAMAYSADRGRVVMFGGSTGSPSDEAWEWDGASWHQLPSAPLARFNPTMVHDAASRRMLVFGGWTGSTRIARLEQLRDGRWDTLRVSPEPPPRNHAAMVYDDRAGRALLFGGHDGISVFGDLWAFDGRTWIVLTSTPAKPRIDNGH